MVDGYRIATGVRTWRSALVTVLALCAALLVVPAGASAAEQPGVRVTIDGGDSGRTFDGVGGLSAGASSRLLFDYPEPQRSQILDYLFKPGYGASMDILKVEIGGDTNSTDGSEASHERERGRVDCDRGYEWWLMEQAKARNPEIKLWGLEWGAPGWFRGGFWSADNIDYLLDWMGCADRHGLTVDYLGGWNERGFDKDWYIALDRALADRYPQVEIVAADQISQPWQVATAMREDPAFGKAVDIVGVHDPCGQRSLYQHCPSTDDALALGKPLWDSEQSSEGHDVGAEPLARAMNRHYLDGKMTSNVNWALLSAWYAHLPIADTGLMLAETPWSGHYRVGKSIWVDAHTTQFTDPGWRYLDHAGGYLPGGGSYVTLRSPDSGDYTTVIETMDATAPQRMTADVTGGLSHGTVHEWRSDLRSGDPDALFAHTADIAPDDGRYTVTLQPGRVYTLSTTSGQHKGAAAPPADAAKQLRVPYHEDFDGYRAGRPARYFSDVNGGFETAPCGGHRRGMCYRQTVTAKPIAWNSTGGMDPTTVVGDPRWWGDNRVAVDAMLERPGSVELLGRVDAQRGTKVSGYHLRVWDTGRWSLYSQDLIGADVPLATGTARVGTGSWHRLALGFAGTRITVRIDGAKVATVHDGRHRTGSAGLRTTGFAPAQFDRLSVTPSAPAPAVVPHSAMTVTATSEHAANYRGYEYSAPNAVDDRPETMWNSEFSPPAAMPQALTVDLGSRRSVQALTYQPRLDGNPSGMITGYDVELSTDGKAYHRVARGSWPVGTGTKVAAWPREHARYVRLTARSAAGCPATAAVGELGVVTGAGPAPEPTTGDSAGPPFTDYLPQAPMSATASSQYSSAYLPSYAIDGDCGTFWHSAPASTGPLPATLTLDLGGAHDVEGLTYLPRQDGNGNGLITGYRVAVSTDGTTFTTVADGTWPADATGKWARWPSTPARYLRLTAVSGSAGVASVAEVEVAGT